MTRRIEVIAEAFARRTDTRRTFLGRLAKAGIVALTSLAAGIPMSMIVEASDCTFTHGYCNGCPTEGCPAGCSPDYSYHDPVGHRTYCWSVTNPYAVCCDCICNGSQCGCRSTGVAPAA
jgi:hypothetical protein